MTLPTDWPIVRHDWPDANCKTIMAHIRNAMKPTSRLVIRKVLFSSWPGFTYETIRRGDTDPVCFSRFRYWAVRSPGKLMATCRTYATIDRLAVGTWAIAPQLWRGKNIPLLLWRSCKPYSWWICSFPLILSSTLDDGMLPVAYILWQAHKVLGTFQREGTYFERVHCSRVSLHQHGRISFLIRLLTEMNVDWSSSIYGIVDSRHVWNSRSRLEMIANREERTYYPVFSGGKEVSTFGVVSTYLKFPT